jgi:hypothetical protein
VEQGTIVDPVGEWTRGTGRITESGGRGEGRTLRVTIKRGLPRIIIRIYSQRERRGAQ